MGEVGLAAVADNEILQRGRQEGRVVVTLDAGFPSVVHIRIEGLTGPMTAIVIGEAALRSKADLVSGALVTVQPGRIRIRRLPLSA